MLQIRMTLEFIATSNKAIANTYGNSARLSYPPKLTASKNI